MMNESRKPRLRKVYVVPNAFTAGNLFLGVLAVVNVFEGNLETACWCVGWATVLDLFDGAAARLTRTQSQFGLEFDSLADLVSFGLAPAMAMYALLTRHLTGVEPRLAAGACILFVICAALRLARYNVQAHGEEREGFGGLPVPGSGGVLVGSVLCISQYNLASSTVVLLPFADKVTVGAALATVLPFVVLGLGLLMVSEVRYPSPVLAINFRERLSLNSLVRIIFLSVLVFALTSAMRVALLAVLLYFYALLGVVRAAFWKVVPGRQLAEPRERPSH